MSRLVSMTFRGEEIDVETNNAVTEWHFYGMTAEQYNALNVTGEEEDAIQVRLMEVMHDDAMYSYDEDRP